jgi:hypothetical protein
MYKLNNTMEEQIDFIEPSYELQCHIVALIILGQADKAYNLYGTKVEFLAAIAETGNFQMYQTVVTNNPVVDYEEIPHAFHPLFVALKANKQEFASHFLDQSRTKINDEGLIDCLRWAIIHNSPHCIYLLNYAIEVFTGCVSQLKEITELIQIIITKYPQTAELLADTVERLNILADKMEKEE